MAYPTQTQSTGLLESRAFEQEHQTDRPANYRRFAEWLRERPKKESPAGLQRFPFKDLFPSVDPDMLEIEEAFTSILLQEAEGREIDIRLNGSCVRQIARYTLRSEAVRQSFAALRDQFVTKYGYQDEQLASLAKGPDFDNIVIIDNPDSFGDLLLDQSKMYFERARLMLAAEDRRSNEVKDNLDNKSGVGRFVEYEIDDGIVFRVSYDAVPTNPSIKYGNIQVLERTRGVENTYTDKEIFAHHIGINIKSSAIAIAEQRYGARLSNIANLTMKLHYFNGMVFIDEDEANQCRVRLDQPVYFGIGTTTVSDPPARDKEIVDREHRIRILHPPEAIDIGGYNIGSQSIAEVMFSYRHALLRMLRVNKEYFDSLAKGIPNGSDKLKEMYRVCDNFGWKELLVMVDNPYLFWWLAERTRQFYGIPFFQQAKDGAPPWTPRSMLMLRDAFYPGLVDDPFNPDGPKIFPPLWMRNEREITAQADAWFESHVLGLPLFKAGIDDTLPKGNAPLTIDELDDLRLKLLGMESYKEPYFTVQSGDKETVMAYESWRDNYLTILSLVRRNLLRNYNELFKTNPLRSIYNQDRIDQVLEMLRDNIANSGKQPWDRRGIYETDKFRLHPLEQALLYNFALVMNIGSHKSAVVPPAVTVDVMEARAIPIRKNAKKAVARSIRLLAHRLARESTDFNHYLAGSYPNSTYEERVKRYASEKAKELIDGEESEINKWYPSLGAMVFSPPTIPLLIHLLHLENYSQFVH